MSTIEKTFLQQLLATLETAGETILVSVIQGLIAKNAAMETKLTEKTTA